MTLRSLTAAALVAASLGALATPASARTVTVMGMSFQQPSYGAQDEALTTGSLSARHDAYRGHDDGYHGRAVAAPAANR